MARVVVDEDLYERLGIEPSASLEQVTAAFRARAKRLHPDLHPGDPAIAEQFKALTHAYNVLTDPVARATYDRRRLPAPRPPTAPAADTRSREPLFKTVRTARLALWSGVVLVTLGIVSGVVLTMVPTGDAGKTITLWLVVAKLLVGGAVLAAAAAWRLRRLQWAAA
jgi:DnaJ domain